MGVEAERGGRRDSQEEGRQRGEGWKRDQSERGETNLNNLFSIFLSFPVPAAPPPWVFPSPLPLLRSPPRFGRQSQQPAPLMLMVGICPFVLSTRAGDSRRTKTGIRGCDVSFMFTHRVDLRPTRLRPRFGSGDYFWSYECEDVCWILRERCFYVDFFIY